MKPALLFLAIGVATLLLRSSFIMRGESAAQGRFDTLRRFVPIAALTALVVPSVFATDGELDPFRLVAIAAAAVVARRGNVLLTVVAGMVVLLALRAY